FDVVVVFALSCATCLPSSLVLLFFFLLVLPPPLSPLFPTRRSSDLPFGPRPVLPSLRSCCGDIEPGQQYFSARRSPMLAPPARSAPRFRLQPATRLKRW